MTLIEKLKELKNFLKLPNTGCKINCNQGRNCKCNPRFSEAIMEVHSLASSIPDADLAIEVRKVADRLAVLGNRYHDRYGS